MVKIEEYQYDYWMNRASLKHVTLTCLMPNGLCIPLTVPGQYTFSEIKEDLWYAAQKLPLFGRLYDLSKYTFCFVNSMAELEEVTQESKQLDEVQPICALLKIVECHSDKTEQESLNTKISQLIGKKLPTFDALNNPEVNQFRFNMRSFVDKISKEREKLGWKEQLVYQCPPRMHSGKIDFILDECGELNQVYQKSKKIILLSATAEETTERSFKVSIESHATPSVLVKKILDKTALYKNLRPDQTDEYVLKVCGRDEYLIGEHPLVKFQYIVECISWDKIPSLIAISRFKLPQLGVYDYRYVTLTNQKKQSSTQTLRKKGNERSVWTLENKFQIVIQNINDINSFICDGKRNSVEMGVLVGLFHGGKSVCEPQKCKERMLTSEEMDSRTMVLNETLTFDIQVCNIPKSVKLCFAVYEMTKNGKSGKTKRSNKDIPMAWANTTVFDFRNQLKTGAMTLFMWNYAEDVMFMNEDLLHPLGTVVSNPNVTNSTSLTLTCNPQYDCTIVYPSPEEILNYVDLTHANDCRESLGDNPKLLEELKKIFGDSIGDIHEQDKQKLWNHRHFLRKYEPGVLPKLLQCIDWDNKDVVCKANVMIQLWDLLPVERALELLDYAYAEDFVRAYAVRCLNKINDDDLLLYLLQLVQGLKHELYLECDLVKLLLERALKNQKIGHYLFWHLKSEMQVPSVCVRFGLVLEAYCRGSQDHMEILYKQTHYLDKLKKCSEKVRNHRDKEKARSEFIDHLKELKIDDVMRDLTNPLDPSFRVKRLKFDKIKIMDSKMRPVWLVLENADPSGEDIYMIFKNGDDLRQDMLTLQMLQIMDKLWKQEGLDLRLNLYKCISMEYRVGLIEVVLNADTIANIQKEKGLFSATSAFRKGSILDWLREHNTTEVKMKKGTVEFLKSCAGYCVATYVLGVGDRHSDNIMVKRNGQLFHIDFGHILGHFKEKFGFKRERVPFVLTHDFVHVINKGEKKAMEFKTFQLYCEQAFMVLRKHGEFILSLFAMMISTGLPELSSEKDLNYLRETLVLSLSEEAAKSHFQSKFNEALSNSWKTSMNWATHNISKNNKVN